MYYFRICLLTLLALIPTMALAGIDDYRQEELRYMLEQDCGSCHGLTRKGGLGTPLLPENMINKSDEYLLEVITNGIEGTPMPPWNALLTQEEIKWMIKELREFDVEAK